MNISIRNSILYRDKQLVSGNVFLPDLAGINGDTVSFEHCTLFTIIYIILVQLLFLLLLEIEERKEL